METKIISLVNQKGGVGKTTSAVNLAVGLSLIAEKKVLLIDLDPQGNSSTALGVDKESFKNHNIYHVLIGAEKIDNCMFDTSVKNLKIVPSDNNLAGAEIELVNEISRETILKKIISKLEYDYIIIDCPPSLGLLTINSLTASHSCLIPMQAEIFSVEGVTSLINTISLIKNALNEDLEILGIFLTMVDTRTKLHNAVKDIIKGHFSSLALNSSIPRSVKLSESFNHGLSIFEYNKKSKGAEAYLNLMSEVFTEISDEIDKYRGVDND